MLYVGSAGRYAAIHIQRFAGVHTGQGHIPVGIMRHFPLLSIGSIIWPKSARFHNLNGKRRPVV